MNLKRIFGIGLLTASISTTAYTLTYDYTPRLKPEQQEKAEELKGLYNQIYANNQQIAALAQNFPRLNICTLYEGMTQRTINDILYGAVKEQTYLQQIMSAKSKLEEVAAQAEPLNAANLEITDKTYALEEQLKQDGSYDEIKSKQKKRGVNHIITFLAGIGITAGAGLCMSSRKKDPNKNK